MSGEDRTVALTSRKLSRRRIAVVSLLIAVGLLISFLIAWVAVYPEDYDPKNIHYVLWKHGLNSSMNLDHALVGMSHDTGAEKLVAGMSKEQLRTRFGFIRSMEEATPYLQLCNAQHDPRGRLGVEGSGKEVVFLRDSPYMVVLETGKATELVLCKGY